MRNRYRDLLTGKHWLLLVILISGCAAVGTREFGKLYGPAEPHERAVAVLPAGDTDYWTEVKPILENRCVVCHGCYDAPCQLKLSSIEGIERGGSKAEVYATRIREAQPTRIFEDAHSVAGWREKGFYPVLNERADTPDANREASVMYRMLALKDQNPLPDVKQLPDSFDLSLERDQSCAADDTFDKFTKEHPLWGMPYALPGLPDAEQDVLKRWIEQGAVYTKRPPLALEYVEHIKQWEAFINGDSLKEQLVARYLFEHLYFAHLYFPDLDNQAFFTVVRSATPPGEPIELIVTRRPYDDPGVERVYYRIQPVLSTIVTKTHMPYRLDEQRMQRWQSLFVDEPYEVTQLPSYVAEYASNPFITFDEMPTHSRYQFLLDEAQFTIMAFIKGTVCRGQVALSVIQDDFWVFFTNPDSPSLGLMEDFMAQRNESLQMPAAIGSVFRPLTRWRQYKKQQQSMLSDRDQYIAAHVPPDAISLDLVWDGDGVNDNAALTVFRHFDSATVEKGLLGQTPKTAWVIGYGILERIHYLLVAGYDVFGNVGHQLMTRLYMDFLRMEAETNFLQMLPAAARARERDLWYQGIDAEEIKTHLTLPVFEKNSVPNIDYKTDDQKQELFAMLEQRLKAVLPTKHELSAISSPEIRNELERLHPLKGRPVNLMPEVAFVQIHSATGDEYVSLVANRAYSSMTSMLKEQKNRLPADDTLSVIPGFIGAYPNTFYRVDASELGDFVDAISSLEVESDYADLLDDYGVRRTDPDFWPNSDTFHQAYWQLNPLTSGMLDFNRLENR